jgi:hypothetical protein
MTAICNPSRRFSRSTARILAASLSFGLFAATATPCQALTQATLGSTGINLQAGSISTSIAVGGALTRTTDLYSTQPVGSLSDFHAINLNTPASTITGLLSGQGQAGSAQLQASAMVDATAISPASSTAASNPFLFFNDYLTLSTTTLPAGTPEEFNLSATVSDNIGATYTGAMDPVLTDLAVIAALFAQPVTSTTASNTLTGLPIIPGPDDPAPGTYRQTLSFQAGQTIEFAGELLLHATAQSPSGPLNSETLTSNLSFTLTPVTPGATFTSQVAGAYEPVPEPVGMGWLALAAMALLARRRVARAG